MRGGDGLVAAARMRVVGRSADGDGQAHGHSLPHRLPATRVLTGDTASRCRLGAGAPPRQARGGPVMRRRGAVGGSDLRWRWTEKKCFIEEIPDETMVI
eukprot:g35275.t1